MANTLTGWRAFLATAALALPAAGWSSDISIDYDFPNDDWKWAQVLGADDALTTGTTSAEDDPTTGSMLGSFDVTVNDYQAFGFLQSEDLDGKKQPIVSANILGVKWTLGSDAPDAESVPEFRLRMTARDGSFTQAYVLQDAAAGDGHVSQVVPTALGDYTFQSFTDVPPSVVNSKPSADSNGFVLAFDVMSFDLLNPNRIGNTISLKDVQVQSYNPGDLSRPKTVYQDSLTTTTAWQPSGTEIGGYTVEHLQTERGIGIRTFGPGAGDPADPLQFDFSFGWWELKDAFVLEPGKIYRVKFVVSQDRAEGEATESTAVPTRLRLSDPYLDSVAIVALGAAGAADSDDNPSSLEKNYFAWIAFPEEVAAEGLPVSLYWDVWQDLQPVAAGTSMFLKEVQIKSYDFTPR